MKKVSAVVGMVFLLAAPLMAQDQAAAPASSTTAPAPAHKKAKAPKGAEAGVKKVFEEVSEAWAAGDAKAIASYFTVDSSIINPMGVEGHGREGVESVAASDLAGPLKGTQQAFDDFNIRFYPLPNVALVDCTATLTGMKKPDGTDADPMKLHLFSVVVNRSGKKWEALLVRPYAFLQAPAASTDTSLPSAASDISTTPAVPDVSATPAAASPAPSDNSSTPAPSK